MALNKNGRRSQVNASSVMVGDELIMAGEKNVFVENVHHSELNSVYERENFLFGHYYMLNVSQRRGSRLRQIGEVTIRGEIGDQKHGLVVIELRVVV